jgi:hypothetical protein
MRSKVVDHIIRNTTSLPFPSQTCQRRSSPLRSMMHNTMSDLPPHLKTNHITKHIVENPKHEQTHSFANSPAKREFLSISLLIISHSYSHSHSHSHSHCHSQSYSVPFRPPFLGIRPSRTYVHLSALAPASHPRKMTPFE